MNVSFRFPIVIVLLFLSSVLFSQKAWTLTDCINYAHKNNLQVQQAQYGSKLNEAYLKQAKANRLPSLSAAVSPSYRRGQTFDMNTLQQIKGGYYYTSFSASLDMPLFKGGTLQNTIRQNKLQVKASSYDEAESKESLSLLIVQSYLQILQLEEQIVNSNNQITSSAAQLKNTQEKFDKGLVAENAVVQQEAQLANEQWQWQQNVNMLKNAKITLMQLMEMPAESDFEVVKPMLDNIELIVPNQSAGEIYKTSLAIRPQVKSAQLETESSVLGVRIAKGQQLPSLSFFTDLNANYLSTRKEVEYATSVEDVSIGYLASDPTESVLGTSTVTTSTTSDLSFWDQLDNTFVPSVGVTLSIPIFSNRSYKTAIEVAQFNSELAKLSERNVTNQLRKDIELAYSDVVNSNDQYLAAEKQFSYAEKTYQNAEYQYENGLINTTDFFIEKNNFATAENNFVLAKYQYLFSHMILDFYSGKPLALK